MAKALFADIFGAYLNNDINNAVGKAYIEKCELDVENRTLNVQIEAENYINKSIQLNIQNELMGILKLKESAFDFTFSSDALCADACADAVAEIKAKNAALNGYFAGANYGLQNDTLKINLKHGGYKKICELEFEKKFIRIINNRFKREIKVEFEGQLEDIAIELPLPEPPAQRVENKTERPKAAEPKKPEIKFDTREDKPKNGLAYLDNPKLFYGRRIETNTKPMIEVTGDDSEICCWGEVFETEVRTINTKRGESNIFTFSFNFVIFFCKNT